MDGRILTFYNQTNFIAGMPNYPASGRSGTGMKKTNDTGTGPVPD